MITALDVYDAYNDTWTGSSWDAVSEEQEDSTFDEGTQLGTLKAKLSTHMSQIRSAGSFATSDDIVDFVLPGIKIDEAGSIRLPLSTGDADALIKVARRAPFGKGNQTIVDESVRKTWEIDAEKVSFTNRAWQTCLDRIVAEAAEKLGVPGGSKNVRAEFYKMLLYEEGAMFAAHRDTERSSNMFGTLVICLPSAHVGGAVLLEHGSRTITYESSTCSDFGASYAAWYSDVSHEIRPVQKGIRWVLTYNLTNNIGSEPHRASDLDELTLELGRHLTYWKEMRPMPEYLVLNLEHNYTDAALALSHLKGSDYARGLHAVRACAQQGDFVALFAAMVLHESNGEEPSPSQLLLMNIVDHEGSSLCPETRVSLRIDASYLIERYGIPDRFDRKTGGDYLGNQHADSHRWYKDCVLLFVPKTGIADILLGRMPRLERVQAMLSLLQRRTEKGLGYPSLEDFVDAILHTYSHRMNVRDPVERMLHLGAIACHAASISNGELFAQVASCSDAGLPIECYSILGKLISFGGSIFSDADIIQVLIKGGDLYTVHERIDVFRTSLVKHNDDYKHPLRAQLSNRQLDSVIYDALCNLNRVGCNDGYVIVKITSKLDGDLASLLRFQGVVRFINRFMQDAVFINDLFSYFHRSVHDGANNSYMDDLFRRTVGSMMIRLDLKRYTRTYCGEAASSPIKWLYERAAALSPESSKQLLVTIQNQAATISHSEQVSLLRLAHEIVKAASCENTDAQNFLQSIIRTFILRFVGDEPVKPKTFGQFSQRSTCDQQPNCTTCRRIDAFLMDPTQETCTFQDLDSGHFQQFRYLSSLDWRTNGNQKVLVKTLRGWEKLHRDWEKNCKRALQRIGEIPKDTLESCLGDQYDEIMSLHLVRAREGGAKESEDLNTDEHGDHNS